MNLQQIFNNAWIGAKSKGFALSVKSDSASCQYRGENGNCCAIGWSIPDEKYDNSLEGASVNHNERVQEILSYEGNIWDVVALQKCHDDSACAALGGFGDGPKAYEKKLRQFASDRGLEIPNG